MFHGSMQWWKQSVSAGVSIILTYFRQRLSHTIYSACDSWILWPDMVSFRSRYFTQMCCCLKQWFLKSKVHRRTTLDTAEKVQILKSSHCSSLLSKSPVVGGDQRVSTNPKRRYSPRPQSRPCQSLTPFIQPNQVAETNESPKCIGLLSFRLMVRTKC